MDLFDKKYGYMVSVFLFSRTEFPFLFRVVAAGKGFLVFVIVVLPEFRGRYFGVFAKRVVRGFLIGKSVSSGWTSA